MNAIARKQPETQVAQRPKALEVMSARLNVDPAKLLETLKQTVFKQASEAELISLVLVANEYGLNPFLKEIHAFAGKGGGIVPVIGVDGWNKLLLRQPDFDGIEFEFEDDDQGQPLSCTATVYVKNRSHPVKITEYFSECFRPTEPWKQMPRRMLRHKALNQASRVAFGFSGIHDEDEAIDIGGATVVAEPKVRKLAPPADAQETTAAPRTPQQDLESIIIEAGYDFSAFQKWGAESGNVPDADSLASFDEVPKEVAVRLLRSKAGLLATLEATKGAAQ